MKIMTESLEKVTTFNADMSLSKINLAQRASNVYVAMYTFFTGLKLDKSYCILVNLVWRIEVGLRKN